MNSITNKYLSADNIGMASSSLCLIHCILTPFIFIAQACAVSCCSAAPSWWQAVDFIFLVISFVAVYFAARTSAKNWIKVAFYVLLSTFSLLMINHHAGFVTLPIELLYSSAFLLFILHLYNKRDFGCEDDDCCTELK